MPITSVLVQLRSRAEAVPRPARLPTEEEVRAAEQQLNINFHPDFRQYLLTASGITYGAYEPGQVTPEAGHSGLVGLARRGWAAGVPDPLLPFCEDNGDYFCLTADGRVLYWSHNGLSEEHWPNLAAWIEQVWLS
ncbi:MAG: SMI1/KNR4 family protein [Roseiflexaceae bacterium]|nr:SMI1/KNR4 family protein [Roseiflexaceae bacterium]